MPCRTTGGPVAPEACSSRTKASFPSASRTPPIDSNRPVSRRSKPSSRSPLIGEQPHPWPLLHGQDGESRHRGSKPPGRYELLPETTLLSLGYLFCHHPASPRGTGWFAKPAFRLVIPHYAESRQAGFCLCTLPRISDPGEPTFGRP